MLTNLKKYQELGQTLEEIRAQTVTRDADCRKVLETIHSQVLSLDIVVGLTKEVRKKLNNMVKLRGRF